MLTDHSMDDSVRKLCRFFPSPYFALPLKRPFYQDRLGTGIGKTHFKVRSFVYAGALGDGAD